MTHSRTLLLALGLLAAGLALPTPAFAAAAKTPDVTVLLRQAAVRLRHVRGFGTAYLVNASGTTASGKSTTSATGITNWSFFYTTTAKPYPTATIDFRGGHFLATKVVAGTGFPIIGGGSVNPLPTMTLTRAVTLLHTAGFKKAFTNVQLVHLPQDQETIYYFTFGSGSNLSWASVGTKSGTVTRSS
jgi:hypothetical protein